MKLILLVPLLFLLKPVECPTDWRAVFDGADAQVNGGWGYSRLPANAGYPTGHLLAWAESYLERGYLALGEYEQVRAHIAAVQAQRDDRVGRRDYTGALNPTWGTDKFSALGWRFYTMNDALVLVPQLEYAVATGDRTWVVAAEETMAFHEAEWRGNWYGEPKQYGGTRINYPLAMDMQATIGKVFVLLHDLTDNPSYRERAAAILAEVLSQVRREGGLVLWPTVRWDSPIASHRTPCDTREWSDTMELVVWCAERGYAVPAGFLAELGASASRLMQGGRLPMRCDGQDIGYPGETTGLPGTAWNDPVAGAYLVLSPYDGRVPGRVRRVMDRLNLAVTLPLLQETWWGMAMRSIALRATAEQLTFP